MSRIDYWLQNDDLSMMIPLILAISAFMNSLKFMLSEVEHEKVL